MPDTQDKYWVEHFNGAQGAKWVASTVAGRVGQHQTSHRSSRGVRAGRTGENQVYYILLKDKEKIKSTSLPPVSADHFRKLWLTVCAAAGDGILQCAVCGCTVLPPATDTITASSDASPGRCRRCEKVE